MILAKLNIDSHLFFYLPARALQRIFSFVDFTLWNTIHISRFVWFYEKNFCLVEVKYDNSIDWSVRVTVAYDFKDFIGIEFKKRGQFFDHQWKKLFHLPIVLLEIIERFQINNLVDKVVEYFFQMHPNPVLTEFTERQIDEELGDHHIEVIVVRSDAHFNTI